MSNLRQELCKVGFAPTGVDKPRRGTSYRELRKKIKALKQELRGVAAQRDLLADILRHAAKSHQGR